MKTYLVWLIAVIAFAIQVPQTKAQTTASDSGTTVTVEYIDGRKETVTWTRMTEAYIFVRTKSGGYNI